MKKDYVADIIQQWIDIMDKENVGVQPKCITVLGTLLSKYNILPKERPSKEDLFDQYMDTKGGDYEAFWSGLSKEEKEYIEVRRQQMRDKYYAERNIQDNNAKSLLKG